MSPSLTSDSPAAPPSSTISSNAGRTLLLSPPSLSSHPEILSSALSSYPKESTDLQMLDRIAAGVASLQPATYSRAVILSSSGQSDDVTAQNGVTKTLDAGEALDRKALAAIVAALMPGGMLVHAGGSLAWTASDKTECILAGLSSNPDGTMSKPTEEVTVAIPLRRNGKTAAPAPAPTPAKRSLPAGVGLSTEDEDDSDDELIDEDTLLTASDLSRPVAIPPECLPNAKKRRRACKDCTCGLAERLEAEDAAQRSLQDKVLNGGPTSASASAKMLSTEEMEVDFTIPGKTTGSCGNCALGDAFRCAGCPYIGLPAFKPGEEVMLDLTADESVL